MEEEIACTVKALLYAAPTAGLQALLEMASPRGATLLVSTLLATDDRRMR